MKNQSKNQSPKISFNEKINEKNAINSTSKNHEVRTLKKSTKSWKYYAVLVCVCVAMMWNVESSNDDGEWKEGDAPSDSKEPTLIPLPPRVQPEQKESKKHFDMPLIAFYFDRPLDRKGLPRSYREEIHMWHLDRLMTDNRTMQQFLESDYEITMSQPLPLEIGLSRTWNTITRILNQPSSHIYLVDGKWLMKLKRILINHENSRNSISEGFLRKYLSYAISGGDIEAIEACINHREFDNIGHWPIGCLFWNKFATVGSVITEDNLFRVNARDITTFRYLWNHQAFEYASTGFLERLLHIKKGRNPYKTVGECRKAFDVFKREKILQFLENMFQGCALRFIIENTSTFFVLTDFEFFSLLREFLQTVVIPYEYEETVDSIMASVTDTDARGTLSIRLNGDDSGGYVFNTESLGFAVRALIRNIDTESCRVLEILFESRHDEISKQVIRSAFYAAFRTKNEELFKLLSTYFSSLIPATIKLRLNESWKNMLIEEKRAGQKREGGNPLEDSTLKEPRTEISDASTSTPDEIDCDVMD